MIGSPAVGGDDDEVARVPKVQQGNGVWTTGRATGRGQQEHVVVDKATSYPPAGQAKQRGVEPGKVSNCRVMHRPTVPAGVRGSGSGQRGELGEAGNPRIVLLGGRNSMTPVMIISILLAAVVLVPLVAVVVGGARVKRTVPCPADEWTPIVRNFGTALARSIHVELRPVAGAEEKKDDGDEPPDSDSDRVVVTTQRIAGRWREVRQRGLVKDESVAGDLASSMTFHRRWIDWRFRVEVKQDDDLTAVVS
jgi:hypothetical protein